MALQKDSERKSASFVKAETETNDHRIIGRDQKLFFFHEFSPGSCFFLPHGVKIYNTLVNFIKDEYRKRGFMEVMTPNIANMKLWKQSGHWDNYKQNMFNFNIKEYAKSDEKSDSNSAVVPDTDIYSLKAMNCPMHCLMFDSTSRSYRELPLRLADFGVLHRNEAHGALTGLTRVRRFCQDDSHLFCEPEQIADEITNCLDFVKYVYNVFGFKYTLALSTRPESFEGVVATWDEAEIQLKKSLDASGLPWTLDPQSGSFYGPKIDISIEDHLKRKHQCATIQLDFVLPEKFELEYQKADGSYGRPVMIHRAILGSVERMFAILCEHYEGKWPFWLSPRQICIVCVDPKYREYASKVFDIYHKAGFNVEVNLSRDGLKKQVRDAQAEQFNFVFVVGQKEMDTNTVNVRTRESKVMGTFGHDDVIARLTKLRDDHVLDNNFSVV